MNEYLLRLNLQFFSEEEPGEPDQETKDEDLEDNPEGDTKPADEEPGEDKKFTQEDIDRIVRERLARERKKQEEEREKLEREKEQEKLREQEKYKELAEELEKELESYRSTAVNTKKEKLLIAAGYTEEQVERYVKYLDGETDEELNQALEALKEDIPPKKKDYADPGAGNGGRDKKKPKNLEDKGKSAYQRLKEKGKIKRPNK